MNLVQHFIADVLQQTVERIVHFHFYFLIRAVVYHVSYYQYSIRYFVFSYELNKWPQSQPLISYQAYVILIRGSKDIFCNFFLSLYECLYIYIYIFILACKTCKQPWKKNTWYIKGEYHQNIKQDIEMKKNGAISISYNKWRCTAYFTRLAGYYQSINRNSFDEDVDNAEIFRERIVWRIRYIIWFDKLMMTWKIYLTDQYWHKLYMPR